MSLAGFATGALLLLGLGAFVVYEGPILWQKAKKALEDLFGSLGSGARAALALPGQGLDYIQTSHDLALHPEQILQKDPLTGQPLKGYIGGTGGKDLSQTVKENLDKAAAVRASEPLSVTIDRLKQQQALLQATGQPFVFDFDTGQQVTLAEVNSRLAGLEGVK